MKLDLDRQEGGRSELGIEGDLELGLKDGRPARARITGVLVVQNMESRFLLSGRLEAAGEAECGRCLATCDVVWPVPVDIMVLRNVDTDEDQGETLLIQQRKGEVDLAPALSECAVLGFPQAPVCSADCRGLCPGCGIDRNRETCSCADDDFDPRWEGLP